MKSLQFLLCITLIFYTPSLIFATTLKESIENAELSGFLRYRYDTGRYTNKDKLGFTDGRGLISSKQNHRWLSHINILNPLLDNIQFHTQFRYGPTKEGGYSNNNIDSLKSFLVREFYVEYTSNDFQTVLKLGKQQMNTIWSENYYDGLVGVGVKIINTSFENLSLQTFIYDNYNQSEQGGRMGDMAEYKKNYQDSKAVFIQLPLYAHNLYGVAALGKHQLFSGNLDSALWFAFIPKNVLFYAFNFAYNFDFAQNSRFILEGVYLGNTLTQNFQKEVNAKNGNFFGIKGTMKAYNFDANLGALHYGNRQKYTITVLEDQGNINVLSGHQIFYTDGSHLNGDRGENSFVYTGFGYNLNKTRIGFDLVYGATKTNVRSLGGKKFEFVGKAIHKYSTKLHFLALYSYLNIDTNDALDRSISSRKNTVRLQAFYKF
ncbi:major outer membrane protein [Campylobacter sp. MIT 21-1685]|uniref:major outer membrane protein n=1 Tax=unclassified Campylobacter TaxID=2593542 RepID=UPI00224B84DB|nr:MULTISPECIES: major outer membrane protein [unclassified Campylobacter]MCX2683825.1 major outer membrane protein [Campylobacter sp. MIT 21-1684]MCX2752103.1 major outer membrane protein [Campylobacter sp. MIT 21-1682]MCX2808302.1 major outer membrane protein [Campylobacter sp. MIT 21-1685]